MNRFKAARAWAKHSEAAGRSPLEAFRRAIDLLLRIGMSKHHVYWYHCYVLMLACPINYVLESALDLL
jgi:hypothetical protein